MKILDESANWTTSTSRFWMSQVGFSWKESSRKKRFSKVFCCAKETRHLTQMVLIWVSFGTLAHYEEGYPGTF